MAIVKSKKKNGASESGYEKNGGGLDFRIDYENN